MIDIQDSLVKVEHQFTTSKIIIFFSKRSHKINFERVAFILTTLVLNLFFNMLHKEVVTYSTISIVIFFNMLHKEVVSCSNNFISFYLFIVFIIFI